MDLSLDDVSAVIRLVREVCDRWDDPAAWREHLLHGACALMDANVGMMLTEHHGKMYHFGQLLVTSVVGLEPEKKMLVAPGIQRMEDRDYSDVTENYMPGLARLYDTFVRQSWVTVRREEMVDDQTYYAAPHYRDFRKHLDCDDYVVSIRMVDLPRRPEGIQVDRPHRAERFGMREVALLKLLHDEIAPLVGVRLATEEHFCRDGLSKRLRETLELLLDGNSEKEAAREMDLSVKTVHEYVGMIYKHFQVSSRAELMAYFIRRTPQIRGSANSTQRRGDAEKSRI